MTEKNVSKVYETTMLDKETGEIETISRTSTYTVESEPPFIKLYINAVARISGLPDGSKSTLFELLKLVDYDGRIILNAGLRRIIAKNIGVKPHTIANTLTQLIKSNIISRVDTGIYLMNPFYFARGKWHDIMKSRINYIKISMMYSEKGEEISIETSMSELPESDSVVDGYDEEAQIVTKPTQLYRHYDKDDNLLYVGISLSAYARLSQHKLHSEWAKESVKMTIENFNGRNDALKAEKTAIKTEKPRFNLLHNNDLEQDYFSICVDSIPIIFNMRRTVQRVIGYVLNEMNRNNELELDINRATTSLSVNRRCLLKSVHELMDCGLLIHKGFFVYEVNKSYFTRDISNG